MNDKEITKVTTAGRWQLNALARVVERKADLTRESAKANANPPIYATIH